MRWAAQQSVGLFGCGRLADRDGEPLRPGGLALTEALIELAGFGPGDRVADVGCGLGASTRLLIRRGVAAVGVDVDAEAGGRAGPRSSSPTPRDCRSRTRASRACSPNASSRRWPTALRRFASGLGC